VTQHSRNTPQFYLTAPSPCPYLEGKQERKVFTHLVGDKAGELNDLLTHGGFRRSQSIAYRPACDQCRACVSVRVIANEFRPSRNFRKIQTRNADIVSELRTAVPTSEQYSVFRAYLDARHRRQQVHVQHDDHGRDQPAEAGQPAGGDQFAHLGAAGGEHHQGHDGEGKLE
jgi:arginyl-tRNA--protein-N-Asp/Glu arginylyltransferase